MSRRARADIALDVELDDLPPELRWREWMGRVEVVIFASAEPVTREVLARVVGKGCKLDLLIDDIRDELRGRPYELVAVAGGWSFRIRLGHAAAIRAAGIVGAPAADLSRREALVLMTAAYFQPVTRGELGQFFGMEVSRDTLPRPERHRTHVLSPKGLPTDRHPLRPKRRHLPRRRMPRSHRQLLVMSPHPSLFWCSAVAGLCPAQQHAQHRCRSAGERGSNLAKGE